MKDIKVTVKAITEVFKELDKADKERLLLIGEGMRLTYKVNSNGRTES